MKSILISGGNSGIGLQAARDLLARGHRVVLLGRDERKGNQALASFGDAGEGDANHRRAAPLLRGQLPESIPPHPTTAARAARRPAPSCGHDDRKNFPLDQRRLRHVPHIRAVRLRPREEADPARNHHYAAHLARNEPSLLSGVVNVGAARTDILRMTPWYMRATAKVTGPLFFNSVPESAHNAVQAALRDDWPTATYWGKPGDFERRTPIVLDDSTSRQIVVVSRDITGV